MPLRVRQELLPSKHPTKKEEESIFFLLEVSLPMFPATLTVVLTCSGLLFSHSPSFFMPTWDLVLLELKEYTHSLVSQNFSSFKYIVILLYS